VNEGPVDIATRGAQSPGRVSRASSAITVSPKRFERWLLAFGVVVLLLGDVWRVPHLLLSRHVVCGEHGELVHEHDVEALRAPQGVAPAAPKIVDGEPRAHAHEHCSVLATAARGSAVVSLPQAEPPLRTLEPERELTFVVPHAVNPRAVLSYAPKQSPPV
jgi:hypothetical protein